jgi:hypothetical protein
MNRRTNGNEQSQRTITWVATFLSLALLVASLALALGSGEAVAESSDPTPSGTKMIWIKDDQKGTSFDCSDGQQIQWHFVITGISETMLAPASITAQFEEQFEGVSVVRSETIPRNDRRRHQADYITSTRRDAVLKDAWTTIYAEWEGQFNLSKSSSGCVGSTPTATPTTPVGRRSPDDAGRTPEVTPVTTPVGTPEPTRTPPRATPTPVTTPVGSPEPTRTPPRATPTPPRATPSPVTTPASESAGTTAMPTSVSEALPATAEPTQTPQPPAAAGQVLPKTGGGPGGSILVGLLGLAGSVLAATGFALEARRRRAMR